MAKLEKVSGLFVGVVRRQLDYIPISIPVVLAFQTACGKSSVRYVPLPMDSYRALRVRSDQRVDSPGGTVEEEERESVFTA